MNTPITLVRKEREMINSHELETDKTFFQTKLFTAYKRQEIIKKNMLDIYQTNVVKFIKHIICF